MASFYQVCLKSIHWFANLSIRANLVISLFIVRVVRQLRGLSRAIEDVTHGRYGQEAPYRNWDNEIGRLANNPDKLKICAAEQSRFLRAKTEVGALAEGLPAATPLRIFHCFAFPSAWAMGHCTMRALSDRPTTGMPDQCGWFRPSPLGCS